jgi:filamentous hemagglutinin family protein
MRVFSLKHTPIALAALLALGAGQAHAQPAPTQLPVQRPGGALINARVGTPSGNALTVTQTASGSNRGLVEWTSFSIGSAARVNIVQPNAQSVLVNRVTGSAGTGPSASEIYGSLSANGRVFLVNPSGVVFGPGAQVNVGSLVASSLDLDPAMTANNYERLMGGTEVLLNQNGAGGNAPGIQVLAADDPSRPQIQVTEGGSILLISHERVAQGGTLSAPGGHIDIHTGSAARLLPVGGSGFVDVLAVQPGVSGAKGITLGPQSQTLASAGSIRIDAGANGAVLADLGAILNASSTASGGAGGQVSLQGGDIRLRGGAQTGAMVLADGSAGGGRIDVGNDATRSIVIEQGSTLSADATALGNGGAVAVRAMYNNLDAGSVARVDYGVAEVYGSIRARGGVGGGNGGQVETSGVALNTRLAAADGTLTHRGVVDASARAAGGQSGTWTLDPFNVTISNATATVSPVDGSFVPSAPGANVNAADLSAALNAGTSVEVTTGTANTGSDIGDITLAAETTITRSAGSGTATLTLRAHNDIALEGGSTIQGSSASPLDIRLYSNLDGEGSGGVTVTGNLFTFGGNVDIGGGREPATGFALSNGQLDGVHLSNASIDTAGSSGRGNVSIRGEAPIGSFTRGVSLDSSSINANNITIVGLSSQSAAVSFLGSSESPPTRLDTTSGLISVRGFADGVGSTSSNSVGVVMDGLEVNLGSAGSLYVAGRAVNRSETSSNQAGVRYGATTIVAARGSTGSITLAGELVNGGLGGLVSSGSGPLAIHGGFTDGGVDLTGANVVLGGSNATGLAIDLGLSPGTDIQTTGMVNLRPLGVDAAGNLVEQPATEIRIGTLPVAGTFHVNPAWILPPGLESPGIFAQAGVVIGSSAHTGLIAVGAGALGQHGDVSLTLQNQGAGSAGIDLGADNTLLNLGLRSTGNMGQTGSINVSGSLVIEGGPQSVVSLNNQGNTIGTVAFDPPASLTVLNTGTLTIGAASTAGYTPGTGFTPLSITTSIGGTTALIQSTEAININQSVTMTGANAQLDVVAPTITLAPGATVTASAGGSAQLWASTFIGVAPGTKLYGCLFGDVETCEISGLVLPSTGNQLLFPTQPTLTVSANPTTGIVGQPTPPLTYTVAGLVNGDTAAGALSGALATAPTESPDTLAITQGSLVSPQGYIVDFRSSSLTLTQANFDLLGITREMLQSSFLSEMSSGVYGRNLDQPYICTAASVIRGSLADDKQGDPLASEWGKVRNQPQLSGCLNVTDGGQCSAF